MNEEKELLERIEKSENKTEELKKIIKEKDRTIIYWIETILLITAIALIIYARAEGVFQQQQISITCTPEIQQGYIDYNNKVIEQDKLLELIKKQAQIETTTGE